MAVKGARDVVSGAFEFYQLGQTLRHDLNSAASAHFLCALDIGMQGCGSAC